MRDFRDQKLSELFSLLRAPVSSGLKQRILAEAENAGSRSVELVAPTRSYKNPRRFAVGTLAIAMLLLSSLGAAAGLGIWRLAHEQERIGPRVTIAMGISEGHAWTLSAYRSKSSGTCVELAAPALDRNIGACWAAPTSVLVLGEVRASPGPWKDGRELFVWSVVSESVEAVRLQFSDGSETTAKLVRDPDDFGFSFVWAAIPGPVVPVAMVALDGAGDELGREPIPSGTAPSPILPTLSPPSK